MNNAIGPSTLDQSSFAIVPPDRIEPEVAAAIAHHRGEIDRIRAIDATAGGGFDAVLRAKEAADAALYDVWRPIAHLNAVVGTPELRAAHAAAKQLLAAYELEVSQDRALHDQVSAIAAFPGGGEEEAAARRLQALTCRDFRLAGVALEGEERARYRAVSLELTALSTGFADAVVDATDAFRLDVTDRAELAGIPDDDVARFRAAAARAGIAGWRIGLQMPDVHAVMTHARSRRLRRRIYEANVTRASDQGPQAGRFDNGERITRIMALRHEAAALLGFATAAHRALATRMAPSPDAVEAFLLDLARTARPAAEKEMREIAAAARADHGIDAVQPWDVAYVSEGLRRRCFALDDAEVRAYFRADRVVEGVTALIGRLFGLRFVERRDIALWNDDARCFDVTDAAGRVFASVYIDLFARAGKRGGAWVGARRGRLAGPDGGVSAPSAFLTCNFAPGDAAAPATLRHDEVVTLLHEFGHVLHTILTEVDYPSIGGIGGVEWDAVELPSQLMENFAWDYEVLTGLSAHVGTGAPLPRDLFDRMAAARGFQAGLGLCRQIELALFDLRLHRDNDPARGAQVMDVLGAVRREVAILHPPAWNRFPHAFTHIFAGGYAAGYYSYLWAELLAADAFGRFREAGGACPTTAHAFRREVLARGATRPSTENFRAFRGRDPDPRALLEHYGLAA